MTQRDGMGREVGGGFRIGNTCIPSPHPSLLALMITFLKEPGGEIPKLLVAEFQVENEQINNDLPN